MTLLGKIKQRFTSKNIVLASAFACAVVAAAGLGAASRQITSADTVRGDCSGNSIDYKNLNGGCGATTPTELIKDIKSNSPTDLNNIYAHYGLNSSNYDKFVSSAEMGTVGRDGRVIVGGQTVASSAWSVGRHDFAGRSKVTIDGKTYYTSPTNTSFSKGTDTIPAMVMFDSKGKMLYAVLTVCGNPVTATPKTPTYACNDLKQSPVSGKANTYNYTTSASAGNGAKITKVVYDFGDGSATVTKTSPTDTVSHTFTKSSTVTVKVYVSVPGKTTIVVQGADCSKKVVVTPPPAPQPVVSCDLLTLTPGKTDGQGNVAYTLSAKASAKNATIQSYVFEFGDKNVSQTVTTAATTATADAHTYVPGTYSPTVSVNMLVNGKTQVVTSPTCIGHITVAQPECKPGIPVGSPECNPVTPMTPTCDLLTLTSNAAADAQGNVTYTLAATVTPNGATVQSYSFDFGDANTPSVITSIASTANVTHTYAPGTYTAKVTATMLVDGKTQMIASPKCAVPVTVTKTPMCTVPGKETLPVNSPDCKQDTCTSPSGQTYPKGSTECNPVAPTCTAPSGKTYPVGSNECNPVTPKVLAASTTLPNTGPGQVVGIFVGVSILGAVAHQLFMRRRLATRNR